MSSTPLISVITPSFNRATMIADAIESVLAQNDPAWEHIIIDGGSIDNTLEVLARYPHLRVVSEPDQGMYDALNKGLKMAQGEIIGWLNTDDLFAPGAFAAARRVFESHPTAEAVMGAALFFNDGDSARRPLCTEPPIELSQLWQRIAHGPTDPNAWFFRRGVFKRYGFFNPSMKYVADRDFLFRAALQGLRPTPFEQVVYQYRQHSGSITFSAADSRLPAQGQHRLNVLTEDIAMLAALLALPTLKQEARRALIKAHSDRTYRLAATAFYHRQFDRVLKAIIQGWRHDLGWPLVFIRMAGQRIAKEFVRR